LYSVRTPRGWLGPARGEFLAQNSPLGPPPVLLADFWAAGRARNPLDFFRWVVPIKARGHYTLCSAIHRAEGVRRAWNSHFKLLAQVAIAGIAVRWRVSNGQNASGHRWRSMEQELRHHAKQRNQLAAPITAFVCLRLHFEY
jgi:hypothetical protein